MATRPNARSISVSQGKGLDEDAAMASALMEATEVSHAETPRLPLTRSSYTELSKHAHAVGPTSLPRIRGSRLSRLVAIEWVSGHNLLNGEPVFVPYDLVHTDYTRRASAYFVQSSNGLASGNHSLEAIIAGLCEVIERDATAQFESQPSHQRAVRRLRPASVSVRECRALLARLEGAGMSVAIWDATSDLGVACFVCSIVEKPENHRSCLGAFSGAGCHPDRSVALARAITEAAQSRLTYIAGSRDDVYRRFYARSSVSPLDAAIDLWEQSLASRRFDDVPSLATDTLEEDVAFLLARLRRAGFKHAIAVDLTDPAIAIPVVRIIVPGLECDRSIASARAGPRLRAVHAAAHA